MRAAWIVASVSVLAVAALTSACGRVVSAEPSVPESGTLEPIEVGNVPDPQDDDAEDDGDGDEFDESEQALGLDEVPEVVRLAAEAALPGASFTSASQEQEDGETRYELSGTLSGAEVEIELGADGQVIEIERG